MTAIIFALVAFVGWGVGDVFAAVSARRIGAYSAVVWSFILIVFFSGVYAPFAIEGLQRFTTPVLILNLALGASLPITWYLFNRALEISNPTIVGTITSAFVALVVLFSIVYFKEIINVSQLVAIIVTFIGVVLTSLDLEVLKKGIKLDKGIFYAVAVLFLWGIYFTFIKIPIREVGWYWPGMISVFTGGVFYSLFAIVKGKKVTPATANGALAPLLAGAVLATAANFSFYFALKIGLAAIVAPIAGAYPVLFVLLSYRVFKEKITKQQALGVVTALIGIITLAFLSS